MKTLATVFCSSREKIFSYFFRFQGLCNSVNCFLRVKGDGCMKDTDHHLCHPRRHLANRAGAQGTRGCAWRDDQFGRAQNTVLGWSDPTFAHGSVAKVMIGVAPAREILFDVLPAGAAGFWRKQGKDEVDSGEAGKNCGLHFHHCQLLHSKLGLRNWFSSLCDYRLCESRRAKKVKSGLRANAYREAALGSPRICQTTCLTFCTNKKGEANCPF